LVLAGLDWPSAGLTRSQRTNALAAPHAWRSSEEVGRTTFSSRDLSRSLRLLRVWVVLRCAAITIPCSAQTRQPTNASSPPLPPPDVSSFAPPLLVPSSRPSRQSQDSEPAIPRICEIRRSSPFGGTPLQAAVWDAGQGGWPRAPPCHKTRCGGTTSLPPLQPGHRKKLGGPECVCGLFSNEPSFYRYCMIGCNPLLELVSGNSGSDAKRNHHRAPPNPK